MFVSMTSNVRKDAAVRFIVTLLSDLTEVCREVRGVKWGGRGWGLEIA